MHMALYFFQIFIHNCFHHPVRICMNICIYRYIQYSRGSRPGVGVVGAGVSPEAMGTRSRSKPRSQERIPMGTPPPVTVGSMQGSSGDM